MSIAGYKILPIRSAARCCRLALGASAVAGQAGPPPLPRHGRPAAAHTSAATRALSRAYTPCSTLAFSACMAPSCSTKLALAGPVPAAASSRGAASRCTGSASVPQYSAQEKVQLHRVAVVNVDSQVGLAGRAAACGGGAEGLRQQEWGRAVTQEGPGECQKQRTLQEGQEAPCAGGSGQPHPLEPHPTLLPRVGGSKRGPKE
jgi:hypothetical protein